MSIDYVLIVVLVISVFTDVRAKKIYNVVLFPAFLFALSYHLASSGWTGFLYSVQGAGIGLLLLFPPYLLGGFGAGDVKLLAVIGAFEGTVFVVCSFFLTAVLGGLMALMILIYKGELRKTICGLGETIKTAFLSRLTVWKLPHLDDEGKVSFPYGVAIALGSIMTFVVM